MSGYSIEIKLEYGEFIVQADTYAECMEKYKEIKKEYENIPCEIFVYKQDQIQFVKQNNKDTMNSLYNELKNVMIKIGQHQIELLNEELKYSQIKNEMYHNLEEIDLYNMSNIEKADYLDNMKLQLTKRRLAEEENKYNFAFYNCYNAILQAMESYKNNKKAKENLGKNRFGNEYYRESINIKQEKLNKLINEL